MSKVYILIGAVGAGKTTCAQEIKNKYGAHIISADEIYKAMPRKKVYTKPYDHKIRVSILQLMQQELDAGLNRGWDCVIDYTNMPTKRRKKFLTIAKRHNAEIVCKLLLVDKDVCIHQLYNREMTNSASHIILDKEKTTDLYLHRIEKNKPTALEGFSVIEIYHNGELIKTLNISKKKKFIKNI